jgi:sulfur carrier protein
MDTGMKIIFNGEPRTLDPGTSVATLLKLLEVTPARVAVEVNQELVPRGRHEDIQLHDGDRVEIVTLVGGG